MKRGLTKRLIYAEIKLSNIFFNYEPRHLLNHIEVLYKSQCTRQLVDGTLCLMCSFLDVRVNLSYLT